MKVKELIAELTKMDPEAEIFIYSELDEGDGYAEYVQECGTPPYCQGDSYVRKYMAEHPNERVVIIHNDTFVANHPTMYYDFEEESETEK